MNSDLGKASSFLFQKSRHFTQTGYGGVNGKNMRIFILLILLFSQPAVSCTTGKNGPNQSELFARYPHVFVGEILDFDIIGRRYQKDITIRIVESRKGDYIVNSEHTFQGGRSMCAAVFTRGYRYLIFLDATKKGLSIGNVISLGLIE